MKKYVLFLVLLSGTFVKMYGQSLSDKKNTVRKVFDNIVQAYGNAKAEPALIILPLSGDERVVACFRSDPRPTIKIDERLVDICMKLKDDSLNALAIIISHELAHYYYDHNFCVDYAYAAGPKSHIGTDLLKLNTPETKLRDEMKADDEGIWHAAIAGYHPFGIFNNLIDEIYSKYKLGSSLKGYPTKERRKEINIRSQERAAGLLPVFEVGLILRSIGEYEAAASCFDTVLSVFPSREIYNNAGAVKLLAALDLQYKEPMEFIYPIELDPVSRLYDNITRGHADDTEKKKMALLKMAKQYFDKALLIDKNYTKAFINLACYYDIEGNYPSAIGKLNEIPPADTALHANSINLIKAIANYHDGNKEKAAVYFDRLVADRDNIFSYNLKLSTFKDPLNNTAQIEEYKTDWCKQNMHINNVSNEQKEYFNTYKQRIENCQEIQSERKINICTSRNQKDMVIKIDDKNVFRAIVYTDINATVLLVKLEESWSREHQEQKNTWFRLNL